MGYFYDGACRLEPIDNPVGPKALSEANDLAVGRGGDDLALGDGPGGRHDIVALQGYILARAGDRDEALKALEHLRRVTHPRQPSPFLVALLYVGLEDTDRAFEWLEKAIEAR